jgi:ABC-type uncharacterized transport system permease subunit
MQPWWAPEMSGWIGGIGGAICGVGGGLFGGLVGTLAPKGKAKKLVVGYSLTLLGAGVVMLIVGVVALIARQPYHVWYPLVLMGGILTLVLGINLPMVFARYRAAEMAKLEAEAMRRSGQEDGLAASE